MPTARDNASRLLIACAVILVRDLLSATHSVLGSLPIELCDWSHVPIIFEILVLRHRTSSSFAFWGEIVNPVSLMVQSLFQFDQTQFDLL